MSGAAIGWAKRQKTGDSTRKLILMALADYAGPVKDDRDAPAEAEGRHFAFVGVDTLAEECECSERTVNRVLTALKASGHLLRVRRMRGFTRTSDYTVLACDGAGDRPFGEVEVLLADALDSADDILSDSGPTSEDAILSDSSTDRMADQATRQDDHPIPTPAAPTDTDTSGACVPYTGTSSNYEPEAELPALRDPLHSPMFLTEPSGDGVWSSQTPSITAEFGRMVKATTEEIMAGWQAWHGKRLPSFPLAEIGKVVRRCVADGVETDAIKIGLAEWTEAGMIAPKFRLAEAIAGAATRRLRRDPQARPSAAEVRTQRHGAALASVAGKTVEQLDAELERTMQGLVERAKGLGSGVTLAIGAGS